MARNEEKAMAMLNRWVKMKRELNLKSKKGGPPAKGGDKNVPQKDGTEREGDPNKQFNRPEDPRVATTITEAEIWRGNIVREIIKKVSEIQNGSLGEYRIRELNDRINELLREKTIWEERVAQLGGANYIKRREEDQLLADDGGVTLPGAEDYKYFGAAKNLPQVREQLEKNATHKKQVAQASKAGKIQLIKRVSAFYLGLAGSHDDPDSICTTSHALSLRDLEQKEAEAEKRLRTKALAEKLTEKHIVKKRRRIELMQSEEKEVRLCNTMPFEDFKALIHGQSEKTSQENVVMEEEAIPEKVDQKINVPQEIDNSAQSVSDLQARLAEKKKRLLMEKYTSSATEQQDYDKPEK